MRIVIHPDRCIAAGFCVAAAPDLFDQNEDDGIVILLSENLPQERIEPARTAARKCPTAAIEILEDT